MMLKQIKDIDSEFRKLRTVHSMVMKAELEDAGNKIRSLAVDNTCIKNKECNHIS